MLDMIKRQAVAIAKQEQERRAAAIAPQSQPDFQPIPLSDLMSQPLKPKRQPLRAWAELAALHLTHDDWDAMVWHVADTVKPFDGDIIRFFETAFEGLTLKDGFLIVP